jgi:hypothetical protein
VFSCESRINIVHNLATEVGLRGVDNGGFIPGSFSPTCNGGLPGIRQPEHGTDHLYVL